MDMDMDENMDVKMIIEHKYKCVNITYSECEFVAFCIQHAKRMRRFISLSVACTSLFFPHYLTNGTKFVKIIIEHMYTCVWFCLIICLKYFSF
jgi:hypothetical protein